jgi:hypothetical protein
MAFSVLEAEEVPVSEGHCSDDGYMVLEDLMCSGQEEMVSQDWISMSQTVLHEQYWEILLRFGRQWKLLPSATRELPRHGP